MDGRTLSFRLAGINNQNFIMQDRETGSWWQQVSGEAIQGPLRGKRLTRVFHEELTFRLWREERAGGRVLAPAADSAWIRFSENWEAETARLPVRVNAPLDSVLPPREVVAGIALGGRAMAFPVGRVLAQAPLHARIGGVPVTLLVGEDGVTIRAVEARLDSVAVELVRVPDTAAVVYRDAATGSRWRSDGLAVEGPLAGRRLPPVYVLKDYWFDWKTYNPDTGVYLLGPSR